MGSMVRPWLRIAATLGAALAAIDPATGATGEPVAPPASRVLHVCDCPPYMANEERAALLRAFAKLGYVQGKNLQLVTYDVESSEARRGGPALELLAPQGRGLYAKLVASEISRGQAQLVLASGIRVAQGARDATQATPIVFWRVTDPVGLGFVASLGRPGANATGFSRAIEKLTVKRLELMQEMLPSVRRVAFLYIADNDHHRKQADEVDQAGKGLGLEIVGYPLPLDQWSPERLEQAFEDMRRSGIEAVLLPDTNVHAQRVVELLARHRLPSIHALAHAVTDWGGLAAYTTTAPDELAGVAAYAVRLLKGEKVGNLPVQEPTQFELLLNARAARDIGIAFPPKLRARATRVIEK